MDGSEVVRSSACFHCFHVINLTLTSGLYRGACERTIESSYIGETLYENEAVGRLRRGM